MKLIYCTECGTKLSQKDTTTYICQNGHPFWNNPRAATAVILIKDGQALFSKRAVEPAKDRYDFPGGFVDYDETAEECARRELREEAGIELGDLHILDCARNQYIENVASCDVIYICTSWKGTPKPDQKEVGTLEWKPIDFIDSDQFAWGYTGVADTINAWLQAKQNLIHRG